MHKKVKYSLIAIAAVLGVAVLIPVVGIGVEIVKDQMRYSKPANFYADAWNIAFPESAKETYSLSTGGRDSWSYRVYTVDPEDDAAFTDCQESVLSEKALERITEHLETVQVSEEQRPDLTKTYRWKRVSSGGSIIEENRYDSYADSMYVLYDEQTDTVYTFSFYI